jgi:hypothetical protein
MWKASMMLLILGVANIGFAEEKQFQPVMYAPPHAEAYNMPSYDQAKPAVDNNDERVQHFLQAAEHLEAAGFKRAAEELRHTAKGGKESINASIAAGERSRQPQSQPVVSQPYYTDQQAQFGPRIVQPGQTPPPMPYSVPATPLPIRDAPAVPPNQPVYAPIPGSGPYPIVPQTDPSQQYAPPAIQNFSPTTLSQNKTENQSSEGKPIVILHLSVIEVSQTKLKNLGFERAKLTSDARSETPAKDQKLSAVDELFGQNINRSPGGGFSMLKADDPYFSTLQALVKDKFAKVVAQPTMVTESGRMATFNSGGEIPMPAAPGNASQTVEYKEYGNRFDFCPAVLDQETIRMEIHGRISEPDYKHLVKIDGTDVPVINSMNFDTALQIKSGQVTVLGGLNKCHTVETLDNSSETTKKNYEEIATIILIKAESVEALVPVKTAGKAGIDKLPQ